jgi:hypothetical protein
LLKLQVDDFNLQGSYLNSQLFVLGIAIDLLGRCFSFSKPDLSSSLMLISTKLLKG